MNADRTIAILRALHVREPVTATSEEVAVLERMGLLRTATRDARAALETTVAPLPSLAEQARAVARSRHAAAGPLSGFGPGGGTPLREITSRIEQLTRLRASLDALVWSDAVERYLEITLEGRRTLTDLAVWRPRVGDLPLEAFLEQMAGLRRGLESTIRRADAIVRVAAQELPYMAPDLRTAALILARESQDPLRTATTFVRIHRSADWRGAPPGDSLLAAALLATVPVPEAQVLTTFQQAWMELLAHDPYPEMQPVIAASLAELSPEDRGRALGRLVAIRPNVSTRQPLALLALASSPYTVEEAWARYKTAQEALMDQGIPGGDGLDAAAAILTTSPMLVPVLAERVGRLLVHLRGVFDPPVAPAAMLAWGPLEPNESIELFKEAVGAVSRTSFFDVTLEIEDLALLLVYGSGPEMARFSLSGIPPPPVPLVEPVLLRPAVWYAYHDLWIHRGRMTYLRSHPAHIHTVPYFG